VAPEEKILDLGAIETKVKKVKLGENVYDLPELTVLEAADLFALADRAQQAETPEELTKAVTDFAAFMETILPEVDRAVWRKLSPEQIGALIAHLSPFQTNRAARRAARRRNGRSPAAR
jgi:hypothetical protein